MNNNETKLCVNCGTKPVSHPSDPYSTTCSGTCYVEYMNTNHPGWAYGTDDGYDAARDRRAVRYY